MTSIEKILDRRERDCAVSRIYASVRSSPRHLTLSRCTFDGKEDKVSNAGGTAKNTLTHTIGTGP